MLIFARSGAMCRICRAHHRLQKDIAILWATTGARDMELREAVQIAVRFPSRISLIITIVGTRFRQTKGKCWSHKDIPTVSCSEHGVDLRRVLSMDRCNCD